MKVSELSGVLLDYWVARAEGLEISGCGEVVEIRNKHGNWIAFHPSVDWSQGGPLIDKHRMYLDGGNLDGWAAATGPHNMAMHARGTEPLQAICRAVVRANYGDEVPQEPQ